MSNTYLENKELPGSTGHMDWYKNFVAGHRLFYDNLDGVFNEVLINKWVDIDLINGHSISGFLSRIDSKEFLIIDDHIIVNPSAIASVSVNFDIMPFFLLK